MAVVVEPQRCAGAFLFGIIKLSIIGKELRETRGSYFFVHISVHLFQKSTKINKNKNYKNLIKLSLYSFYLFLYFISFRWQGTFLSL